MSALELLASLPHPALTLLAIAAALTAVGWALQGRRAG